MTVFGNKLLHLLISDHPMSDADVFVQSVQLGDHFFRPDEELQSFLWFTLLRGSQCHGVYCLEQDNKQSTEQAEGTARRMRPLYHNHSGSSGLKAIAASMSFNASSKRF
jgi:hypothetical protein